jgi:hypothetical protein
MAAENEFLLFLWQVLRLDGHLGTTRHRRGSSLCVPRRVEPHKTKFVEYKLMPKS